MPADIIKCHCSKCGGGIEFDSTGVAEDDPTSIECPHCHEQTTVFIPKIERPELEKESKTEAVFDWCYSKAKTITKKILSERFERAIFVVIRCAAILMAILVLLCFASLVVNYLRGFPPANPSDANTAAITRITESKSWQNFGLFLLGASFLFAILTVIGFALLLLAIERNTRRK